VPKRLENRVALVTGSTSGIGLATANRFSEEGAQVVLAGRRRALGERAEQSIRKAGGDARYFESDFSRMESVRNTVRFTLDTYGRIDILVNNTVSWATARDMPVTRLKEEDWDYAMAVGLKAPYVACQEAIPAMAKQGGGRIIMMGSIRSFLAFSGGFAYDIVKAGLVNMARQLTVDFGQQGIRANVLCPGWIATDVQRNDVLEHYAQNADLQKNDASQPGALVDAKVEAMHPVGRTGLPIDVANAAVFLASEEASFVAGAVLVVDGGLTVQTPGSFLPLLETYYRRTLVNPTTSSESSAALDGN
jgi:3-oxoacyl-[acyl-carrier protein] reductase